MLLIYIVKSGKRLGSDRGKKIKNEQSRETGNIGYTRRSTRQTKQQTQHRNKKDEQPNTWGRTRVPAKSKQFLVVVRHRRVTHIHSQVR